MLYSIALDNAILYLTHKDKFIVAKLWERSTYEQNKYMNNTITGLLQEYLCMCICVPVFIL